MLLLSREDIKSVITMKEMIEADKQAFKMVADGTVNTPLRTVINGKYDGAFLFMLAYAPELADRQQLSWKPCLQREHPTKKRGSFPCFFVLFVGETLCYNKLYL